MKLKSQVITFAFASGLALAPAAFCRAQAQDQTRARTTEVAKLNEPASPPGSPGGAPTTTTTTDTPDPSAKAADPAAPAAIADELDALKKRIEELELELKSKPAGTAPATTAAPAGNEAAPAAPATSGSDADFSSSSSSSSAADAVAESSSSNAQGAAAAPAEKPKKPDPFSLYDYTWMNANSRNHDTPLATKYFTPEVRVDTNYILDYNHPVDHTMGGATESFRSGEIQLEQVSVGGDLRVNNVRFRILTMDGLFATTTPRNDASFGVGQWDLRDAYKYFSEAWGGYHFNVNNGLNVDAGIFVSYIGLFSYYNFDNWAYQPSFVSSNTPWFFNGVRIQWFPTAKLKIEPWFINGWQSYAKYNSRPGLGGQILWRPNGWFSLVLNNYGMGTDVLGNPMQSRIHTDDSVEVKYYDHPNGKLDYMAWTFTGDLGCEYGAGTTVANVSCFGGHGTIKETFMGAMAYNRWDFAKNHYGITVGGGFLNNPGRYLALLPPINGADAVTGSPYFTENPGDKYHGADGTITFDWMPDQFITFRLEEGFRHSDVPYWSGKGGITPPGFGVGGTNGAPGQYACSNGAPSGIGSSGSGPAALAADEALVEPACFKIMNPGVTPTPGQLNTSLMWFPDLVRDQFATTFAVMVKF
jgi:putative OmpL-like beta-barrel porin-2